VSAGGQFAAAAHAEAPLTLDPAGPQSPEFDHDFETAHGPVLARQLQSLPKVEVADQLAASRVADLIRDSYGEYWTDQQSQASRTEALAALAAALPNLTAGTRDRHMRLIRFAVHTEMKHWQDQSYVLNAEHGYELLIDPTDYDGEDNLLDEGQDDNREQWAALADTAAAHALAENTQSERKAA
jgi:hypothetical protein